MMKDLSMIACVSQDGGLGNRGELLWHIPEDMKFFRETTRGSAVIMGRKTFESIGRALPGRKNIVLSSKKGEAGDVEWCTRAELEQVLSDLPGKKFIIGGASLYEMFLPVAESLYLTEVAASQPADTYFPKFDRETYTKENIQVGEYDGIRYQITKYTKKDEHDAN